MMYLVIALISLIFALNLMLIKNQIKNIDEDINLKMHQLEWKVEELRRK